MPEIKFAKNFPSLQVSPQNSLMKELLGAGLPVASSCGGDGVCAKCRVFVLEGAENLSPAEESELQLAARLKFNSNERLSCQAKCLIGSVRLDTDYW